jgi:non-specific protein-tyrosine kinase
VPEPPALLDDPRSPAAEAYRLLAANLGLTGGPAPPRALLVASPGPGEGASRVAANLARVAAEGVPRVILVDADLRQPAQHALFGVAGRPGLAQLLAGATGTTEPAELPLVAVAEGRLALLPAGTGDATGAAEATGASGRPAVGSSVGSPGELLGRGRVPALLAALRAAGDLVILDAPPVTAVADAALLAPHVDGVLLVLTAGRSRRDETARARELLDHVGARVLGVALIGGDDAGRGAGY